MPAQSGIGKQAGTARLPLFCQCKQDSAVPGRCINGAGTGRYDTEFYPQTSWQWSTSAVWTATAVM